MSADEHTPHTDLHPWHADMHAPLMSADEITPRADLHARDADMHAPLLSPLPPELLSALHQLTGGDVDVAIVLGSGLGQFADTVELLASVSTSELPGYPISTIEGHQGRLHIARAHGLRILLFQGRVHGYEGYSPGHTALPARIAAALHARVLVATNAAGGLDPAFAAGDLMLITDLLVLPAARHMGLELQGRFTPETPLPRPLFSPSVLARARDAAEEAGVRLREGTYGFCSGPTYETRSEIAFFRLAGAHAAGMSTAPEIIAAARAGLPVLAVSCITNVARTVRQSVSHAEVTATAARASGDLARLVHAFLRRT